MIEVLIFLAGLFFLVYIIYYVKSYHGFELISKNYIDEIKSNVIEFKHKKTGAKLMFLENNDDNKVFSIAFKTPAHNDKGVNHILEHSVLCGSRKYPVKDPFLVMNKQSLQTFLNAYTGVDYTMFPVASKNEKDLFNLMDVYLDAVFYPNIYTNKNIFKQEGFRYELFSIDDEITYNGVVYNEMKGEYSSANTILINEINKSLFPDTLYKYEFGGNPNSIPDLTYEEFLDTHKKYYHPSNCQLYLYGNLNLKKTLKIINKNYLKNIQRKSIDTDIPLQSRYKKMNKVTAFYNVEIDTDIENMTYLSLNYVIGDIKDTKVIVGLQILADLLLGSSSSPLRKAFEENDIGYNWYASYDNNIKQHVFSIIVENANYEDCEKFEQITKDVLIFISKNGFNENLVKSILNSYEINIRSSHNDAQRGISYADLLTTTFIYDIDIIEYLKMDSKVSEIRKEYSNGFFEKLINDYILNNTHSSLLVLKPKQNMEEENELNIQNKLKNYKNSLSENELYKLIKDTKDLNEWQDCSESKNDILKMPTLSLKDIKKTTEKLPIEVINNKNITILNHKVFTNKIGYINLYFDSMVIKQDDIFYLKLLCDLLGEMDTKNKKVADLSDEISTYTGGIFFNCVAFTKGDSELCPKIVVNTSAIDYNISNMFKVLKEIIKDTSFDNKKLLKGIIQIEKSDMENELNENAQEIAVSRLNSYFSDIGQYDYLLKVPYYNFLCLIEKDFDNKYENLKNKLYEISNMVFNTNNLIVSYTGKNYNLFKSNFDEFSSDINCFNQIKHKYHFEYYKGNDAFIIPSKVQYVVKGASFQNKNQKYSGKYKVIENILNNEYLWKNVRVKGGAYACELAINTKDIVFSSYRDPNLKQTLNVYDNACNYLKSFKATKLDMTNFIIGSIASMDMPISPYSTGYISDIMYISGKDENYMQNLRNDVLNTKVEDINNFGIIMEEMMKQNRYCIIGNKNKIMDNKDLFNDIKNII